MRYFRWKWRPAPWTRCRQPGSIRRARNDARSSIGESGSSTRHRWQTTGSSGLPILGAGAGVRVEKRILIDGVDGAVKGGQRDRMGSGIEGLNGIARLSQMSTLGTDITNLEYPICG